ncbi:MAG: CPBP family intramembrane metalloprotease [Sorangiineae bacterium]|nr:CPBP family intramembrane metalloprotease [Polyangiaceae bacterium]MEB2320927.1 CPBP family intramembrane metalloprotease [Sorangiineae bacterium]
MPGLLALLSGPGAIGGVSSEVARLSDALAGPARPSPLELPLTRLAPVSTFQALLDYAPVKALLPIPILALIAPALWWFFRDTWKRLDAEATEHRVKLAETGAADYRAVACLSIVGVVLTMQYYFGGEEFYSAHVRPWLVELDAAHSFVKLKKYSEFYSYVWWVFARVAGYVLVPFPLWKLLFRKDSLLDMGFRVRGFFSHLWIYGLGLAVVVPVMLLVSHQPDFGGYYPFYKQSSRSYFDLMIWESIYFLQFLSLEMFFRGWMVGALRKTMGSSAIFAMAVPYCMIHYGKPYLEAVGAIVAGVFLGSLAMRTRSIYAGFLVHITVALSMDFLALWHRGALPTQFWASG